MGNLGQHRAPSSPCPFVQGARAGLSFAGITKGRVRVCVYNAITLDAGQANQTEFSRMEREPQGKNRDVGTTQDAHVKTGSIPKSNLKCTILRLRMNEG